jgi:hypothetical protein
MTGEENRITRNFIICTLYQIRRMRWIGHHHVWGRGEKYINILVGNFEGKKPDGKR